MLESLAGGHRGPPWSISYCAVRSTDARRAYLRFSPSPPRSGSVHEGRPVRKNQDSAYDDVTEMLRHLGSLDDHSVEYRRQREAIIARCLPLADHIATRFARRGEARDDLVQVARIGLIHAVNRYDCDLGTDFLAFAVPTMMGEVRRYFRDHGWSVSVPRRMKELSAHLKKAREELFQELGRAPTASEIARHLRIDREEVVQAQIASSAYATVSYDAHRSGASDDEGWLVSDSFGVLDANLDRVVDVETVRPLLAALPEREQTVLLLRFFENMTQSQIADRLGMSQMHVSRLLARSLTSVREQVQRPLAMSEVLPAASSHHRVAR